MVNFGPLTPEITRLMFTHPKSTVRVLRILMHLSAGHVTLLPLEFYQPKLSLQSHLGRRADSCWASLQISSPVCYYMIIFPVVRCWKKQVSFCHDFAVCILLLCIREASWHRMKLEAIKMAMCLGSTILSAAFLGWLNHDHISWPTLSIIWRCFR